MSFTTLVYHEFRDDHFDDSKPSHIDVASKYADILPLPLFTRVKDFENQIKYLVDENYYFMSVSDMIAYYEGERELPEKSVFLTFDDAFQSVYHYAYPILKNYNLHAAMFVVSGWLHEEPSEFDASISKVMSRGELTAMHDVFEFCNHTDILHEREGAKGVIQLTDKETLLHDIGECSKYVDYPEVFAYPFGFYDEKVIKIFETSDIKFAFTTNFGKNNRNENRYELNRNVVAYKITHEQFTELVK